MEPDRYEQNHKFYIAGLVCLIISMFLFGLGAYILPRIAFGLNYNIPNLIFYWITLVHLAYDITEHMAGWLILLLLFLMGFLFSIITYLFSNHIETKIYAKEEVERVEIEKVPETSKETGPLVLKIIIIVGIVFVIAKIFQWAISTNQ